MTTEGPKDRSLFREVSGAVIAMLIVGVAIGIGATFVHLDEAVYTPARVVVQDSWDIVQTPDSGRITDLSVHEGESVAEGQQLLILRSQELEASRDSIQDSLAFEVALRDRIKAELLRKNGYWSSPPAESASVPVSTSALQLQASEFGKRQLSLSIARSQAREEVSQSEAEAEGLSRQLEATSAQRQSISQELDELAPLYREKLVPASRIRTLERSRSQLDGELASLESSLARSRSQASERKAKLAELALDRDVQDSKDLADAETEIVSLRNKLTANQTRLAALVIRSPCDGEIVHVLTSTLGAVVSPGEKLIEIVPSKSPLIVEAFLPPKSIDGLLPGVNAKVRVTSFQERDMTTIMGRIVEISPDVIRDSKDQSSAYRIKVAVSADELERVRKARGKAGALRAGLTAEVLIPLKSRTALEYLVEPLSHILWKSFHER